MLRQQELQQTRETLAARAAEVEELKARVAELEQLQQKQNELIALKDSELAAAQQRLGNTQAATAPAATPAGMGPWLGAGAGLLAIGLLAWWWMGRRRSAAPAAPRRDLERLAAAVPRAKDVAADPVAGDPAAVDEAGSEAAKPSPRPAAPLPAEPGWNRLAKPAEPEAPRPAPPARGVPTWHAGSDPGTASPQPGQVRLDLAKAYLDMGDRDTARTLLQEVAARGDSDAVRDEAARMLQELG